MMTIDEMEDEILRLDINLAGFREDRDWNAVRDVAGRIAYLAGEICCTSVEQPWYAAEFFTRQMSD